ncbi:leucine-responsive regulatory protein [Arthrobacter sp. Hiyo8]|jgi:DNA-binding Lrp family transcriptional regulator|uniref:DNA-binding Lrp family transcriptional regulator n=2 Tax=Arthrobacter TaxID=1663 RepID=A0AAW8DLH2_9MICC|nr:DNA-binding Lrp family transcriptional regulator [Arthrobacter bambusae]BAS15530.1 leucine-responsive regulatory protein [Arthrobacter sp. Hiyo8]GAP59297.1 leucine-responsive regulatory protein [Arthrobacter sp. Hiyo1]MDQ0130681.1 DNA-binding Lrp family transcriptional regulator [Arthrobacter bambusae]MDQ0182070.1 DNA-binding Lrp family transcriptional regulator [Arthrobacter bambusae]
MTATALAAKVGLTVAPCHRRLRDLEASGVIRGYRADIDPGAIGLGFEAIVFVTLRQADRTTMSEFEDRVAAIPNIVEAQRLFGSPDYLLRVIAADLPAYQRFYDDQLSALPAVERLNSTLVMKNLKPNAGPPV